MNERHRDYRKRRETRLDTERWIYYIATHAESKLKKERRQVNEELKRGIVKKAGKQDWIL